MAFTIDREWAAARLGVSSRTIDRHIQAGRIRTRRIGKKMFLEDEDVELLRNQDSARKADDYVIIMDNQKDAPTQEIIHPRDASTGLSPVDVAAVTELVRLYEETRTIIAEKDNTIKDLSYKLGKVETELRNTVPLVDYNKATFLLETAKTRQVEDANSLQTKIETLEKEVNKRNGVILSITLLFILVLGFSIVFFFSSQFM